MNRQRITIRGRVQGVGCRPYIYRLAVESALTGMVCNDTRGVTIEVQGSRDDVDAFRERLTNSTAADYPALMEITDCRSDEIAVVEKESVFHIIE
ncbi:MAG: acylphosphatase, partial [Planctomycetota bacterium]